MPKQRFGLGRGLDALIPGASLADVTPLSEDTPLDSSLSPSSVFEAPIDAISPNPQQPRAAVEDDPQLRELAASIREYGLLQPLLVTISGQDDHGPLFQLIAGERRWRAARLAELRMVPVVIREVTPQLMLEMALIENLQRTDLNPLEEAHGYLMLMEEYGLTQEMVAQRIGRNRATIANTVRLLHLPDEVREALVTMPRAFTEGHARAVLQINGDAARISAMKQIIAQGMSVRQAEELARRYNERALGIANDRRGSMTRAQSPETRVLEEEFTRAVEMKVRLQRTTRGKGQLTLYFSSEEQLHLLYARLVGTNRAEQNGHDVYAMLDGNGALDMSYDDIIEDDLIEDDEVDEGEE
ncbi:MAG TPA: ParB/RepB/Spo0J family partition protein [Ktedonobacterales bacterium]|nr:ParB/RepB/Spo0J family partition protein [Ktedonobacterales bacterium]